MFANSTIQFRSQPQSLSALLYLSAPPAPPVRLRPPSTSAFFQALPARMQSTTNSNVEFLQILLLCQRRKQHYLSLPLQLPLIPTMNSSATITTDDHVPLLLPPLPLRHYFHHVYYCYYTVTITFAATLLLRLLLFFDFYCIQSTVST